MGKAEEIAFKRDQSITNGIKPMETGRAIKESGGRFIDLNASRDKEHGRNEIFALYTLQ